MLFDIPLTTGLMLRSIAGIARGFGEDPSTEEGRRACLEVFALGTDGTAGAEGQVNYWAAAPPSAISRSTALCAVCDDAGHRIFATAADTRGSVAAPWREGP